MPVLSSKFQLVPMYRPPTSLKNSKVHLKLPQHVHISAKQTKKFKMFPKLPMELRNMIVKLSTKTTPKIVTISYEEIILPNGGVERRATAYYEKPAFLEVNKECREVVRKMFTAAFSINLGGAPVYFNFNTDALLFHGWNSMNVFYGYDGHQMIAGVGPSSNKHPLLMVGITWPYKLTLSPLVLQQLGKPKHVTFVSPSGGKTLLCNRNTATQTSLWWGKAYTDQSNSLIPYWQKNMEVTKTYAEPTVTHKSRLRMGKLLDEIDRKNTEEKAQRVKDARDARKPRAFSSS
ncbi:hypothetical protein BKA61DRAFT_568391 [Leptodontidium sp. MPI-SDFR-AT-0119]|nr:hypothetical protein BKA61DRAFT_568391 [Leptodontidium sp. MPI-SDFR-AT-0119]